MPHVTDVETELGGLKQWLLEAEARLGPEVTECHNLGVARKPGVAAVLQRDAKMLEHKVGRVARYFKVVLFFWQVLLSVSRKEEPPPLYPSSLVLQSPHSSHPKG